ncbi:MAG: glycerol-3-phosphate 1-O-acyltransferase PlsY [Acetobacteraceae bacterium]|nr:glycerol-3-phosphate 1-O-acyltransferase PlsY [Acetobacteraceae bacterium]
MTAGQAALLAIFGGGIVGSIPFGLLLTRAAGLGDIRKVGSGNIGATNVLRTGRKGLAAVVLVLDAAKGAAAVLLAAWLLAWPFAPLAGLGAVAGHCFTPWLGFRGGKGVATGLGMVLAIAWPAGLGAAIVWLLAALVTRISSAAALLACGAAPLLVWATAGASPARATLAAVFIIVFRHEANIFRLLKGTEPRIGRVR